MSADGAVLVLARAPERGHVKTRLARALGNDATLALYSAFLHDTLAAARASGARVLLAHTPSAPFIHQSLADASFEQRGATFGARFDAALADARDRTDGALVLVGADTPHLPPSAMRHALDALARAPAVLGPSREGGFHLLGFAESVRPVPVAAAFDSPNECARVAEILHAQRVDAALAPPCFDVDTPEDLADLVLHVEMLQAARAEWLPTRTMRALDALGIRAERGESTRGYRIVTAASP